MLYKDINFRLIKFLISGLIVISIEYSVFILMIHFVRLGLIYANSLSFVTSVIISFILQRNWTFKSKENIQYSMFKQINLFIILALINLVLSNLIILAAHKFLGLVYASKLISIFCIAIWNYIIMNNVIFTNRGKC
ncbi:MAG: hypothetical protein NVSMB46_05360 [Candidatus Saccharimonadales bacterium]